VQRDIGRLAKYTFDMGGAGDLLSLSLNVPPWETLHELSREELRLTNVATSDLIAEVLPQLEVAILPVTEVAKSMQERFVTTVVEAGADSQLTKSTKTAEAIPSGANVATAPAK
jgi:hypothetical protein